MDQPLILSIEFAPPPAEAPPEILAAMTLSTDHLRGTTDIPNRFYTPFAHPAGYGPTR